MTTLGVVVGNLSLLFGVLMSANMALTWGELASFDLAGDKSALAGLGGALVFMAFRWLALAVVLGIAVWRGGFGRLPGSRGVQLVGVEVAHGALGVGSYQAFESVVGAIQRSDPGPLTFGWMFGVAIPLVVFGVGFFGLNAGWVRRRPLVAAALVALIVSGHLAGWREGYR